MCINNLSCFTIYFEYFLNINIFGNIYIKIIILTKSENVFYFTNVQHNEFCEINFNNKLTYLKIKWLEYKLYFQMYFPFCFYCI